jgi:hypothetical protein
VEDIFGEACSEKEEAGGKDQTKNGSITEQWDSHISFFGLTLCLELAIHVSLDGSMSLTKENVFQQCMVHVKRTLEAVRFPNAYIYFISFFRLPQSTKIYNPNCKRKRRFESSSYLA